MIVTESEAHRKRCPVARAHPAWWCVGSECMVWRWSGMTERGFRPAPHWDDECEPARPSNVPASWEWQPRSVVDAVDPPGWLEPEAEAQERRRGHCGLVSSTAPELARAVLDATLG